MITKATSSTMIMLAVLVVGRRCTPVYEMNREHSIAPRRNTWLTLFRSASVASREHRKPFGSSRNRYRNNLPSRNSKKMPQRDKRITGEEVLLRSQNTYAALTSYVGSTKVESTVIFPQNKLVQSSTARITFMHPKLLRIEGKTTPVYPWIRDSGAPYKVVTNGETVWRTLSLSNSRGVQTTHAIEDVLEGLAGVTQDAAKTLPIILLQIKGHNPGPHAADKRFLEFFAKGALISGQEVIGGRSCYRVASKRVFGVWTFWVDTSSFLLRQLEERQTNAQIRLYTASKSSGIKLSIVRQTYSIERTNADVDMAIFSKPHADR